MTASNIPISSKALYDAYVAWRDCPKQGEKWDQKTRSGLCYWTDVREGELGGELYAQFSHAGLHRYYPFSSSSSPPGTRGADYVLEAGRRTQHLNPARIKWVNDRIADYEKHHGLF